MVVVRAPHTRNWCKELEAESCNCFKKLEFPKAAEKILQVVQGCGYLRNAPSSSTFLRPADVLPDYSARCCCAVAHLWPKSDQIMRNLVWETLVTMLTTLYQLNPEPKARHLPSHCCMKYIDGFRQTSSKSLCGVKTAGRNAEHD